MIRRPPRSTLFPYTNALPIYQLAAEPRSEQLLAPLEVGLDEVAGEQQDQHHQQNDVHVQERQHQDVGGDERRGLGLVVVVDGQPDHRDQEGQDGQDGAQVMDRTVNVRLGSHYRRSTWSHDRHLSCCSPWNQLHGAASPPGTSYRWCPWRRETRRRNPPLPLTEPATRAWPVRRGGAANIPRPPRSRRRRGGLPFEEASGRSRAARGWGSDGQTTAQSAARCPYRALRTQSPTPRSATSAHDRASDHGRAHACTRAGGPGPVPSRRASRPPPAAGFSRQTTLAPSPAPAHARGMRRP